MFHLKMVRELSGGCADGIARAIDKKATSPVIRLALVCMVRVKIDSLCLGEITYVMLLPSTAEDSAGSGSRRW